MSADILNQVRAYKNKLQGAPHDLFRGVLMCKVTGVTFDGRQEVIKKIAMDTPIRLQRDRRNEHDFNAVNVIAFVDDEWRDAGFVPASMNKEISTALDAGVELGAKVWKKVGGDNDFHHGLTITITRS